jgi:hypothetical protein
MLATFHSGMNNAIQFFTAPGPAENKKLVTRGLQSLTIGAGPAMPADEKYMRKIQEAQ